MPLRRGVAVRPVTGAGAAPATVQAGADSAKDFAAWFRMATLYTRRRGGPWRSSGGRGSSMDADFACAGMASVPAG